MALWDFVTKIVGSNGSTSASVTTRGSKGVVAVEILDESGNQVTSFGPAHGKTLKTATGIVSTSGTTLINAVPSKRLKIYAYSIISESTVSNKATFQSGSTNLWATPLRAITGTVVGSNMAVSVPTFIFATTAGEGLTINLSTTEAVTYNLSYWDDDAT